MYWNFVGAGCSLRESGFQQPVGILTGSNIAIDRMVQLCYKFWLSGNIARGFIQLQKLAGAA
jgi:hypothetical protein